MDEGRRPGGLTVLAVFNFVFAGYDALVFAGAAISLATGLPHALLDDVPAEERQQFEQVIRLSQKIALLDAPIAALLIASGVGYLRQRRVLGRYVGNAYAVTSIGSTVLLLALMPSGLPAAGFNALSILRLVYPILVLALLNTTFRSDFA